MMELSETVDTYLKYEDNVVWFYADIDDGTCLQLNALLRHIDKSLAHTTEPIIHLHINSGGGAVLAAMSVIDTLCSLRSQVYTYVEGGVASAATLISCTADKRYMGRYSYMLIHQVSCESSGKIDELESDVKNTRQLMEDIENIYKKFTKLKGVKLKDLLKQDKWINAADCLKYGLVDEII